MNRKKIVTFAMIFILIALLISYFVLNYEPKYAENEITEDLCIEIVRREMEEDMPVQIAGIQKVDDSIIVGYAIGKENQIKSFGFLQFILSQNNNKYELYCNQYELLEAFYSEIEIGSFYTNRSNDILLKPYYIVLSCNEKITGLDVYYKTFEDYQLQQNFQINNSLSMWIWKKPESGKYTFICENNEEWFSRFFFSDTQTFYDASNNELNMRFDVDYADILYGSHTNMACSTTLLGSTNPDKYYVNNLILRQTSRPCTAWNYIKINSISNIFFADFGQHTDDLLNIIEIPQEYDIVRKNKTGYTFIQSDMDYVRSIQVESTKKFFLKQSGQFFNVISRYSDYFNKPDKENELLKENILQIEWLIDVRDNSENETKTYTVRQNVPIIIR
jgi:hypothetical protein